LKNWGSRKLRNSGILELRDLEIKELRIRELGIHILLVPEFQHSRIPIYPPILDMCLTHFLGSL
jgi:hypothetical protein